MTSRLFVLSVWSLAAWGCECGEPRAGGDASDSDVGRTGDSGAEVVTWESVEALECPEGHLQYEYVIDGVRGVTECVTAAARSIVRDPNPGPEREVSTIYAGDAAREIRLRGLPFPQLICGANIRFENLDLVTGAEGALDVEPGGELFPRVLVEGAYDLSPESSFCGESMGAATELVAGEYRVAQGGVPGEVVRILARDVEFAPFDGHTWRFPRMSWHVEIRETIRF